MDRAATFRRAFHIISPIFLSYYVLPDTVAGNLTKVSLAILFVGTAGCIEITRIALGIRLFGMRPYEGQRVSAYAQGLLGLVVGIFVVQDPRIVVPVFLGMAWIDPLRSVARKRRWNVVFPIAAYAALFFAAQTLVGGVPSVTLRIICAAIATTVAMAVEGPRIPQLDDDLTMQLLPMAALIVAMALIPTAGLP
jgi:hypothetical protein